MTRTELEYYNAINARIGDLCDKLMGNVDFQLVLETENEHQYWLANYNNTNNGVPILCWCYEKDKGNGDDIEDIHNWYDLRDIIFELVTSGKVTEYYIEHI